MGESGFLPSYVFELSYIVKQFCVMYFQGNTALHVAYMKCNFKVVTVLLEVCKKKSINLDTIKNEVCIFQCYRPGLENGHTQPYSLIYFSLCYIFHYKSDVHCG